MSADAAIEIILWLENAGVRVWVDGGWGVDALIGEQTREHDDLDVVIGQDDVPVAERLLSERGFSMWRDERPASFVLGHPDDRRVDIHPVRWDAEGGGLQAQPSGMDWRYPPEGFGGVGLIAGRKVRCLTAEVQMLCHDGYELDEGDYQDMQLLAERLGIELPGRLRRS